MDIGTRADVALASGLAFLRAAQTADGEIPIFTCEQRDMNGYLHPDPCIFPTALAGYALGFVPGAAPVLEPAIRFLLDQRSATGVWHHWRRDHSHFTTLPPDIDDTSCVSIMLNRHA